MPFAPSTQKQSFFSRFASAIKSGKTAVVVLTVLAACVNTPSQAEKAVIVSTFAGSGPTGVFNKGSFADGVRSSARFNKPHGIAIDMAGNLYVADTVNHSIRKITPNGEVSTLAGSVQGFANGQGENARFNFPNGITIDVAGNLYVADTGNHRIRKITPNGKVSTLAGSDEFGFADGQGSHAQFKVPTDIVIDAMGNLYVADSANHRIRKITPNGEVSTFAGGGPILHFDIGSFPDGQGSAALFNQPSGIAIDAAGNLYVTETVKHRIRKITPKGEVTTLAGGESGFADGQGSVARFHWPSGIAIDAAGNLYVADKDNHRIRKITPNGEVSTLAGSSEKGKYHGYIGGFADGEGSNALFDGPHGITIDAAGNLYVADKDNHRIRKIVIVPEKTDTQSP